MKPPKCKVCGREHYGPCYSRSAVVIDDPGHNPAAVARLRRELSDRLNSTAPPITVVSRLADAPKKRGRPISDKPKTPRAEYQRELMRKLRAKT